MQIQFWAFYLVPFICTSVFVTVPYCFNYSNFVIQSGVRESDSSHSCFSFSRLFWLFRVFCVSIQIKKICSSSVKNVIGNLVEIALNMQIALGSIVILTVLIFPIQDYSISFCLCCLRFLSSMSYSFWIQVFCLLTQVYSQIFYSF